MPSPVFVQSVYGSVSHSGTSATLTITLSPVTPYNAVGMEISWNSAFTGFSSIIDDKGNNYIPIQGTPWFESTEPAYHALVLLPNISNGPSVFTFTTPIGANLGRQILATVSEISNLGNAPIIDFSNNFTSSFGSGAAVFNFTTNAANEIALCAASNGAGVTVTQNTSWTADVLGGDANLNGIIQAHTLLSSSGANSFSVTPTSGSTQVGFYIATWKFANATGGPIQWVS